MAKRRIINIFGFFANLLLPFSMSYALYGRDAFGFYLTLAFYSAFYIFSKSDIELVNYEIAITIAAIILFLTIFSTYRFVNLKDISFELSFIRFFIVIVAILTSYYFYNELPIS